MDKGSICASTLILIGVLLFSGSILFSPDNNQEVIVLSESQLMQVAAEAEAIKQIKLKERQVRQQALLELIEKPNSELNKTQTLKKYVQLFFWKVDTSPFYMLLFIILMTIFLLASVIGLRIFWRYINAEVK